MSIIKNGMLRGGTPLVIMSFISVILFFQGKANQAKSTFLVALILFVVGIATVIYDIDSFSLLKRSVIHFIIMLVTVYPILLISGWFPLKTFKDALFIFLYFIVVGAVVYTIMLLLAKIFKW